MQRPTPLPPPATTSTAEPAATDGPDRAAPVPGRGARADAAPVGRQDAAAPLAAPPDIPAPAPPGVDSPSRPAVATAPASVPERTGAPGADATTVRLRDVWRAARARRKALRAEVRRFTGRARRRRALWLGAAASVVLLVLVTLGAAYSPLFAVERISVLGTSKLSASAVEQALAGQVGKPLPLVDESAVKAALVRFPLVESYSLEARPPHELVVRVVERTPVGVVRSDAGYTLVDAAGVALSTTSSRPDGQPLLTVTGGLRSDAFEALGLVIRSLPASIRSKVTAASASTPDDVTLTLGATRTSVVWGSADEAALKALVLETTMKRLPPSRVSEYDVSSPRAIVVR